MSFKDYFIGMTLGLVLGLPMVGCINVVAEAEAKEYAGEVAQAATDRGVTDVTVDRSADAADAADCGARVRGYLVTGTKDGQPYHAYACLALGGSPMFEETTARN